jgi:hypothetical protein
VCMCVHVLEHVLWTFGSKVGSKTSVSTSQWADTHAHMQGHTHNFWQQNKCLNLKKHADRLLNVVTHSFRLP